MRLIILAFTMLTVSQTMANSACDQHIICGSYSGLTTAKNATGSQIGHWQETIVLAPGSQDNQVSMTFLVTYEDGSQEQRQYDLIFNSAGWFDIKVKGISFGSGDCYDKYCTYQYSTKSANASGSIDFKGAELIRRQEQVDSGKYTLIEQTLTKE